MKGASMSKNPSKSSRQRTGRKRDARGRFTGKQSSSKKSGK
jgi:hypothetical protein